MHPILHIPTDQIDPHALLRDRTALDATALADLAASIVRDGLRQPVEVWRLADPTPHHRYGLIAGLRRLTAHQHLARTNPAFATIAAFLRTPADIPDAMAAMIAENEIRADLSPWERGLLLATAVAEGLFSTLDQAVAALHPTATRQKRARLRTLAMVAEEFEGCFATPERLTLEQIERLATCLRGGLTDLIHHILLQNRDAPLPTQWRTLIPTLTEAFTPDPDPTSGKPTRPRRMLQLKQGLTIRREKSRTGWSLHFTGPEARSGALIDDVIDKVEEWFQR